MGFELITLVVIGTDGISNCIMTTPDLVRKELNILSNLYSMVTFWTKQK
jgi:hypothetical protein